MKRAAAPLMLVTLLGGCATQWTRSDFSPAQAEQDQLACEQEAEREVSLR